MSKFFLLSCLLLLSCTRATQRTESVSASHEESRKAIQIHSGQTVLEAAIERQASESKQIRTEMETEADSIKVVRTLADGTTEMQIIYGAKKKQRQAENADKSETHKDNISAVSNSISVKTGTVDTRDKIDAKFAEKTDTKGGTAAVPWFVWAIIGTIAIAAVLWRIKKWYG